MDNIEGAQKRVPGGWREYLFFRAELGHEADGGCSEARGQYVWLHSYECPSHNHGAWMSAIIQGDDLRRKIACFFMFRVQDNCRGGSQGRDRGNACGSVEV